MKKNGKLTKGKIRNYRVEAKEKNFGEEIVNSVS